MGNIFIFEYNINHLLHSRDCRGHDDGADNFLIHYFLGRYIGDTIGNVSVLKLNREAPAIELMKYCIPVSEAHGETFRFL